MKYSKLLPLLTLLLFILINTVATAAPAPFDSKMYVYNSTKLQLGKEVKVKATSENVGEVTHISFKVKTPYGNELSLSNINTTKTKKSYYSYGTFVPKEEGTYYVSFLMYLTGPEGQKWASVGRISFKIFDSARIQVSVSPGLATIDKGNEIFLYLKYPIDGPENSFTLQYDDKILEIVKLEGDSIYDGYYHQLFKFKPDSSGSHLIEFMVSQKLDDGTIREGRAVASIWVNE